MNFNPNQQGFAPGFAVAPGIQAPYPTTPPGVGQMPFTGPQIDPNATEEPTSFIVQSKLSGPLCIADIRLNFAKHEIKDLTWLPPAYTKGSHDLKEALRKGWLRKITEKQWQDINDKNEQREKILMMQSRQRAAQRSNMRRMNFSDGSSMEVDMVNANGFGGGTANSSEMIEAVNLANDPRVVSEAFDAWNYHKMGGQGDPGDFSLMTQKNPNLVLYWSQIANNQNPGGNPDLPNMSFSGDARGGRAYVNTPNQGDGGGSTSYPMNMTNVNRDQRLAGSNFQGKRQAMHYGQNLDPNFNDPNFAGVEFPSIDGVGVGGPDGNGAYNGFETEMHVGNYNPFDQYAGMGVHDGQGGGGGASVGPNGDYYFNADGPSANAGLDAYDPNSYDDAAEESFGVAIDLNDDKSFSSDGGGYGGGGKHPSRIGS